MSKKEKVQQTQIGSARDITVTKTPREVTQALKARNKKKRKLEKRDIVDVVADAVRNG